MNRLDDDELVRNIMAKRGRDTERKDFPRFWMETGAFLCLMSSANSL